MPQCGFNEAWIGPCKTEVNADGVRCSKHFGQKCASCGAEATGNCDETMGPLVCGAPLCDNCEHTLCANGCNSGASLPEGMNAHCKKGEQKFKMWMEDGAEEHNAKIAAVPCV